MPRSFVLVVIGIAVFFVTAALFLLIKSGLAATPAQSPLACNEMLIQGDYSRQTNLLFVGGTQESQEYSDYLFAHEPFASHKESFNIYRIDKVSTCERYKGIALFCYSRELLAQAAVCPHDYIIALEDASATLRSSAYMGVASINTRLPKTVLLHEVGHLFNLDEEYKAGYNPGSDSPNCKSTCAQFGQESCYQECSDSSHSRSVDEGVMRTLSPQDVSNPYGTYNRNYLAQKITRPKTSTTGFAVQPVEDCADQSNLIIEVTPGNTWQAHVVDIESGCAFTTEGSYAYVLEEESGTIVKTGSFDEPRLFTDGNEDADDEFEGETFEGEPFFITVPADTGATTFSISNNEGNELASGSTQLNDLLCRI